MLPTFVLWSERIAALPENRDNPVVGLAADEPEVSKMISALNQVDFTGSTVTTREGPFLAVRSCKKLSKAQLEIVRAILFGVHVGSVGYLD